MDNELVFNPRKISVAMVAAELAKRPDLTIDELKALLAHEGTQIRPRNGVEKLLDARLLALAEEAIEAASEDMVAEGGPDPEVGIKDEEAKAAPDPLSPTEEGLSSHVAPAPDEEVEIEKLPLSVDLTEGDVADAEAAIEAAAEEMSEPAAPIDAMTDAEIERQPDETVAEHVDRLAEAQGVKPVEVDLTDDEMAALTAAVFGPVAAADDSDPEPEDDQEAAPAIAANTPVHVTMTNGEVHEGYYVKEQAGAMIRMRDGQDTVIFVPDQNFWVSPSDEDEGGD